MKEKICVPPRPQCSSQDQFSTDSSPLASLGKTNVLVCVFIIKKGKHTHKIISTLSTSDHPGLQFLVHFPCSPCLHLGAIIT